MRTAPFNTRNRGHSARRSSGSTRDAASPVCSAVDRLLGTRAWISPALRGVLYVHGVQCVVRNVVHDTSGRLQSLTVAQRLYHTVFGFIPVSDNTSSPLFRPAVGWVPKTGGGLQGTQA